MNEKNKQEEIQSRREFFKKAAKSSLPVLGAIVLSSLPLVQTKASGCDYCMNSCDNSCYLGCDNRCDGSCRYDCLGTCQGRCSGGCQGNCSYDCQGNCKGDCYGTCKGSCGFSARF